MIKKVGVYIKKISDFHINSINEHLVNECCADQCNAIKYKSDKYDCSQHIRNENNLNDKTQI